MQSSERRMQNMKYGRGFRRSWLEGDKRAEQGKLPVLADCRLTICIAALISTGTA